ncbi:MAG TPA: hypothetical protein VF252_08040 [Gemmatimonadales bacterium]
MLDDGLEDRLKDAARDYHAPPETPREAMWAAIQARRIAEGKEVERKVRRFSFRPFRLPAGIAAILALGFGLGRLSRAPEPVPAPEAVASETRPRGTEAYRVTATEHLSQSEAFLTLFRASVRRGGNELLASATARQLLATNRLLLDSPAAGDARTRLLLQDLELVLAEIAQLSPQPRSRDLDLIKDGLEQGGVLSRLRTAVPAGASTTQGAL